LLNKGRGGFGRPFLFLSRHNFFLANNYPIGSSMPDASTISSANPVDNGSLRKRLARYANPDRRRAISQLLTTTSLLLASGAALLYGVAHGIWLAAFLALPAAAFLVRLFIIQHDCGHGSFFGSRRANDTLGLVISLMTLIPYTFWRKDHALHHATAGNLDRRGRGDLTTLTVREYLAQPLWQKVRYRLYRHPLILFGIGPAYMLLIRYRIPTGDSLRNWHDWVSIVGTNIGAALGGAAIALTIGPVTFLVTWSAVLLLSISIGIWFFYIQHQFEDSYWERSELWNFQAAALKGSSFYDLPRPLHWLSGSIGFHHVHHLANKIPNYRLRECFDQVPEMQNIKRLSFLASLKAFRLALWDEERRQLISFRSLAQRWRDQALTAS
jgi:omega-6 fatty acid desaturase (delta-12 desaturase)